MYRPGKDNAKADVISRREQDVGPQDKLKAEYCTKALLQPTYLDPYIVREIPQPLLQELMPIEPKLYKPIGLVNRILTANRTITLLITLQA